jgi:hypothetical protein
MRTQGRLSPPLVKNAGLRDDTPLKGSKSETPLCIPFMFIYKTE